MRTIVMVALLCALFSATCQYMCVYCGLQVVSGCTTPSRYGHCDKSPDGLHLFTLVKQL